METTIYFFPLIVLFSLSIMACSAKIVRNITTDEAALLVLKNHITLHPYHILENNWSTSNSVCDWIGVTCSLRHHRVTALNISGMNLTGTLPPQLANLSFLASLDLSINNFHGNLLQELANLHRLQVIVLSYNSFSGQIPVWMSSFSKVRHLSLRNNSFTGFIPHFISNVSKMENLDLSYNSLQGEIPEEIGDLHYLKTLSLSVNQLTGPIPSKIFNISTLESIGLGGNLLSGELPVDVCHSLPRLQKLGLSLNSLSGQIPQSISNCSELQQLGLSYNKFERFIPGEIWKLVKLKALGLGGNDFSKGVIPQEISNLHNLKILGMEEIQLIGSIPPALSNISTLQELTLHTNELEGSIPHALFNISTLQVIDLGSNKLKGEIPEEISNLYKLEEIMMINNSLSGPIPMGLFNMSNLKVIFLYNNQLSGSLPSNMGYGLPNLQELSLSMNNLNGVIPNSLSNSTKLKLIQLDTNQFIGKIPDSLGNLNLIQRLTLDHNNLMSQGFNFFVTSLTKCQYLKELDVSSNPLGGNLPVSIGNFSSLEYFDAQNCKIRGRIPSEIGNLRRLIELDLSDNYLTGSIPITMKAIQGLYLANNSIDGSTLYTLCELPNLFLLDLDHNNISGPLPECLGNVTSLRYIYFRNSGLTSIPSSFWNLKNVIELRLSSNSLNGSLSPKIGSLNGATHIDLSMNQLSGDIPNVFAELSNVVYLHLDHNKLEGSIPDSLGKVVSLEELDLSYNNLSGSIPKSLEALKYLKHFNVSFNILGGLIPSDGPFRNFTSQSFIFNDAFCGDSRFQVSPCPISSRDKRRSKHIFQLILIPVGIVLTIFVMVVIFLLMRYRRKDKASGILESFFLKMPKRISYYELLEATDRYNESNLLGSGGFGSVYKGILKDGVLVAVKVFNLQLEGAFKSFDTECEVLRNLRHRNLTKVISSCSAEDFKALVLQYLSNGSLEKWLYSHNYYLNFIQRLNIMIDIACALEYLHYGYSTTLIHCDLKPSNVLLDEDMVAHVSDFGIAKLLGEGESIIHTNTLATMGYIAPEYGLKGIVSTRCDVYSFGIMMMEVFTRTKPSDDMFAANLNLKKWVSNSTPHAVIEVVDANLIRPDEEHFTEKLKCLSSIMELALCCSVESPNERINMKDVVAKLKKIKLEFVAHCGGT